MHFGINVAINYLRDIYKCKKVNIMNKLNTHSYKITAIYIISAVLSVATLCVIVL